MSDEKKEPLTAEEILEKWYQKYRNEFGLSRYESTLKAMHEFSDQQTKALRDENERLIFKNKNQANTIGNYQDLISEYVDRVSNLETSLSAEIAKKERLKTIGFDLQSELTQVKEHNKQLVDALEKIKNWELPETGNYWDERNPTNENKMSYEACYGSNGVRDYIKQLAKEVLFNHQKQNKP